MRLFVVAAVVTLAAPARAEEPRELVEDARALLVVGACAEGPLPASIKPTTVAGYCKRVRAAQQEYKDKWVAPARDFFAAHVPKDIPKIVVYPFAGGDLTTALTVYPDAEEITTLSLEPAGDPRALAKLDDRALKGALAVVEKELTSFYRKDFSVTMNMIGAMRGGELPTQLIFSLSALAIHGYEPVSLRYFRLTKQGEVVYLTEADFVKLDAIKNTSQRNHALANMELRFHKKGDKREQVYRHIEANLDDKHLKVDPSALAYLEKKSAVAAMTKAASYLLTFDDFSSIRKYIVEHVVWMVSDSTGLPPKIGLPAGFDYEVYGAYELSNMAAGAAVTPQWRALYKAQPKRDLPFRFGYPDKKLRGHLIIMRKKQ